MESSANPDDTHECPGPGCKKRVPREMLACRRHWYQVAPAVRAAVWRAWRAGNTADHAHAMRLAIRQMQP